MEAPTEFVLSHCPFCADDAKAVECGMGENEQWIVECLNRECHVLGPFADTEQEAVEAWNTRYEVVPPCPYRFGTWISGHWQEQLGTVWRKKTEVEHDEAG